MPEEWPLQQKTCSHGHSRWSARLINCRKFTPVTLLTGYRAHLICSSSPADRMKPGSENTTAITRLKPILQSPSTTSFSLRHGKVWQPAGLKRSTLPCSARHLLWKTMRCCLPSPRSATLLRMQSPARKQEKIWTTLSSF